MSAAGTKCGIHGLELEQVRPGKWLCPEPECTHIITDAMVERMREFFWAQENGMVHPDAIEIPVLAAPSSAGPRDGGGQQDQDGAGQAREQHGGTPG